MVADELPKFAQLLRGACKDIFESLRSSAPQVDSSSGFDIKLNVDETNDISARTALSEIGLPVFSEEQQFTATPSDYILLDGLDGSFNFFRGLPFYALSAALIQNNEYHHGFVCDLARGTYYCDLDGSAFEGHLNSSHVDCLGRSPAIALSLKESCLVTGFPLQFEFEKRSFFYDYLIANCKKKRMYGSATMSILMVAKGLADVYYEEDIFTWDVAGALMIAKNAGCRYRIVKKQKEHCLDVLVCASPKVFDDLMEMVGE